MQCGNNRYLSSWQGWTLLIRMCSYVMILVIVTVWQVWKDVYEEVLTQPPHDASMGLRKQHLGCWRISECTFCIGVRVLKGSAIWCAKFMHEDKLELMSSWIKTWTDSQIITSYVWENNRQMVAHNSVFMINCQIHVPALLRAIIRYYHLTLWRRNYFFLISAHPVYKMLIIQEPNKLALWNKLHFEEKNTESIEHV